MQTKNLRLVTKHEQICCVTSCELDEQRVTTPNLLIKVDPRSIFPNNFFNPQRDKSITQLRWKTRHMDTKLATKQCCVTLLLLFILQHVSWSPLSPSTMDCGLCNGVYCSHNYVTSPSPQRGECNPLSWQFSVWFVLGYRTPRLFFQVGEHCSAVKMTVQYLKKTVRTGNTHLSSGMTKVKVDGQ